jgi:hypothetical protein
MSELSKRRQRKNSISVLVSLRSALLAKYGELAMTSFYL